MWAKYGLEDDIKRKENEELKGFWEVIVSEIYRRFLPSRFPREVFWSFLERFAASFRQRVFGKSF